MYLLTTVLLPSDWVYKLAGILMVDEYAAPRYQPERTRQIPRALSRAAFPAGG
jgi:hypothetical protein